MVKTGSHKAKKDATFNGETSDAIMLSRETRRPTCGVTVKKKREIRDRLEVTHSTGGYGNICSLKLILKELKRLNPSAEANRHVFLLVLHSEMIV